MTELEQTNPDVEHLRLLGIFHYVCGGMLALVACFPLIHLVIGILIVAAPRVAGPGERPPTFIGWFFIILASGFILAGWTVAGLLAWAGRCLRARKHHNFCLVMACVACLFMPLGTVLGVFTIIVLMRPSAKALFDSRATLAHST